MILVFDSSLHFQCPKRCIYLNIKIRNQHNEYKVHRYIDENHLNNCNNTWGKKAYDKRYRSITILAEKIVPGFADGESVTVTFRTHTAQPGPGVRDS
jgi:hypothetical protein